MEIILASASPRRKELLSLIYDDFKIVVSECDETCPIELENHLAPQYLALKKANAVAKDNPNALVIGADTSVLLDDKILGKPQNRQDAYEMLTALSGKEHRVITGCALVMGDKSCSFSVTSAVKFYDLSKEDKEWYLSLDEYKDKAGSYGIQGKGSMLVEKIDGDYFNIVGLPVSMLNKKIKEFLK